MPQTYYVTQVQRIFKILHLREAAVDITFVDDHVMRRHNLRFMHKRGTTDVLSFPQIQAPINQLTPRLFRGRFLGDIVVSLDQAKRQALQLHLPLRREVLFLIVHSLLHLLGYDHATRIQQQEMQALESLIWEKI